MKFPKSMHEPAGSWINASTKVESSRFDYTGNFKPLRSLNRLREGPDIPHCDRAALAPSITAHSVRSYLLNKILDSESLLR